MKYTFIYSPIYKFINSEHMIIKILDGLPKLRSQSFPNKQVAVNIIQSAVLTYFVLLTLHVYGDWGNWEKLRRDKKRNFSFTFSINKI